MQNRFESGSAKANLMLNKILLKVPFALLMPLLLRLVFMSLFPVCAFMAYAVVQCQNKDRVLSRGLPLGHLSLIIFLTQRMLLIL